ncbi:MAG: hypothetical protein JNJ60_14405, partial [Rhodocyclaceae bacterium]|nr:hypothetical protein [Rhodocyclaceae bacterium]
MPASRKRASMRRAARWTPRLLATAVAVALHSPHGAYANPQNPNVVSGAARFETLGKTLSVTNSANAIINWQSFSIGRGETTRFIQPSAASQVLNRVTGG